jgi:hypothetical protein
MSLVLLVITMVWLPYTIPAPLKRRAGEHLAGSGLVHLNLRWVDV